MKNDEFPAAWDEQRIQRVLAHDEGQTEDEAVAEDERTPEDAGQEARTC